MAIVSLALCTDADSTLSYRQAVERLLAPYGGMAFFVEPQGHTVLYAGQLWPAAPELGLNPQPLLLQALAELAFAADAAEVVLAGRPAPGFAWADILQHSAYARLEQAGVTFCDLSAAPALERQSRLNLAVPQLPVAQPLLQATSVINISKLRAAEGLLFGSALQNLEAASQLPADPQHKARALLDLFTVWQPDLHVVDSSRGSHGYQPQQADALLAATDPVALDMTLTALAHLDADRVSCLRLAAQYGLGSAQPADIHLVGDDITALFGLPQQSEGAEETPSSW